MSDKPTNRELGSNPCILSSYVLVAMKRSTAMRLSLPWLGILLLGISPVLCGQNTAIDLSGTWQLDLSKSHPAKLGKREIKLKPATLVIQCTATTIEMRNTSGGRVVTQTYIPDGKEKIVSQGHGGETTVKTRWKKKVLIIETSGRAYLLGDLAHQSQSTELVNSIQRWTLSADGNTLTHEEENPKAVSVFVKIPAETSTTPIP